MALVVCATASKLMGRSSTNLRSRSAFTLSELLTVIAIIAILAGLLMSAISHAKTKVRTTECKNNLRQLGIALAGYAHDNGGAYPYVLALGVYTDENITPNLSTWVRQYWFGQLMVYCSSSLPPEPDGVFDYEAICPPVFRCPGSYIKPGTPGLEEGGGIGIWNNRVMEDFKYRTDKGVPYAYNPFGTGAQKNNLGLGGVAGTDNRPAPPCRDSDLKSASDMIAIGCSYSLWYSRCYERARYGIGGWHSDQANVLFGDGHIGLVKSNLMVAPTDAARRRWNRDNQPHPETWH